ncbi:MAG: YceI family protein [Deltaproteobacteria bacterium]|nr:YceI family protein [Deltaproteobacteria bacterium]
MQTKIIFPIALVALLAAPVSAQPRPQAPPVPQPTTGVQTFELRPSGISRVSFTSDAPLETVEGLSSQTTGNFTVDLGNPSARLSGQVQITVASLTTGVAMRDEHLRSANWLDAARHPNITFEVVRTSIRAVAPGRTARGNVVGRLTLHGQAREVTVPVEVRFIPLDPREHAGMDQLGINANMLRIKGTMRVNLSDFGVNIMPVLRLKLSNTIAIALDLTSFQTTPAAAAAAGH